jgi:hypothetical protein
MVASIHATLLQIGAYYEEKKLAANHHYQRNAGPIAIAAKPATKKC